MHTSAFASIHTKTGNRSRAVLAGMVATLLASCGESPKQAGGPPPPQVTVASPVKRQVVDYDEYVGRFAAVNSVEIRARVSGYLDAVHFKDGQLVKDGDLLFTIDRRSFENAAAQARANVSTAKSNLDFTEADYTRGQQLVKEKTITDQTFEQRAQSFRNARAAVAGAEAALRSAELDLSFTELRAPIAGRIGDRRVTPGNLVTGGTGGSTTLLATIVSTDPIYFEFTFDEASYLRYERNAKSGKDVTSRDGRVNVGLKLIDEKDFVHEGRMDFIDNVIERTTGTIRGRAVFANANATFTPGMFARVRVPATAPYEGLLVPDVAIGSDQARKTVMTIGPGNKVVPKYVTLGQLVDGKLRVIKEGIGPDDKIIVNGIARVRPGQVVSPQQEGQQGAAPAGAKPAPAK
ncbi:efflux RND transporter periplasmic adaptor subunit [Pseudolabrys sp. FHR47]|uniref:efflux RND transporter periplasmic adaptor subunit n=1 Tax=Pseudolabrys sp. FHR47 TaxID=2562284 RepID=UPI0010BEB8B5|nr:efflux RND transporter periplasmic adaptor subunit [Pseudolabrys sp. FHR47]